jgi:hypothetical protein
MEGSMPPRKRGTTTLEASETKIGEAVPKAVIDSAKASVGIPPHVYPVEEVAAMRSQLEALREQISDMASRIGDGARQTARQVEGTAKLYPMSSVLAVAGLTAVFVFAVTGICSGPPRSRSERILEDVQDLYERARRRF